jgi:flagellar basal-body rod protein FlgC
MASDSSDFLRSMTIATSGLRAQAGRMRVISENIANADSTAATAGGDPYRRKVPTFTSALDRAADAKVVSLGKIVPDQSAFRVKYDPSNPAADATGNVKYPNVNPLIEMTDMRDAQRSYEANLNIIGATRRMIQRTLDSSRLEEQGIKSWQPQSMPQTPTPISPGCWTPGARATSSGISRGCATFSAMQAVRRAAVLRSARC